ncbi:TonB-dependent receptor plug domain-containing protein [Aurantibacillus circumpalustris]|uniref:TonB-dependent receptor plug domain-containing protein n=1 Tax=Aurantibacillus circumpalustris TaxID=3036359 RepID=UPI00295A989A|nr:TonB-dependent receptor [Aurantibacillus circumpalustris]
MILNLDKRFACVLTYLVKPILFCCFITSSICYAQDTISLNDVEISAKKIDLSQIGKKLEKTDTVVKEQFKYSSVADILNYNSSIFIKNYGPGSIATTALRGGNASQTAVLWNGFNLQNAMLGQSDLSLMPSILFESIGVEYGGSSSLWGSGAMGGSIHLNNALRFNQGLSCAINVGVASFGTLNSSASVLLSKRSFASSTKVYLNRSQNNFNYKDTLDKENQIKHLRNSEFNFKGLMQEFKFLINSKQIISVNAWLSDNQRHLPNYPNNISSKTYQRDNGIRITASWSYMVTKFKSLLRAGYFVDNINYTDSLINLFSKSSVKTTMFENENYFMAHKNYHLNVAINILSSSANTENYSAAKTLSRASLLIGNKFMFFKDRLISYVSARVEYFSAGTLPFTGNVSLEYKLTKHITAKINTAKVYRQPTLNELYWLPGGNPNLKPEEGYTYEGEINYTKQIKQFTFFVSGSAYNRKIDNWILWVPGAGGNPSPLNIQKVWSRGTETSWKFNYRKNKFRMGTGVITAYVLSTVESNSQQNDNTVNKQLIYTPRYTVNGNIALGYAGTDLIFYHQYAGYRFTTSDNLNWLNPYHTSSLRLTNKLMLKEVDLTVFAACNNLFNSDYTVLAGRPMPLRSYELGISIKVKQKNKITNN